MKKIPALSKIGFISKPHGFKGELVFAIENGSPDEYVNADFFWIELEGKPVPFFIEDIKNTGSGMIVKLEDVDNEAEAKKISGKKIFADQKLVIASEDEISWESLVGYMIIDEEHGPLGLLERIEEYPQQIMGHCTINGKEILFPLHDDLISEIDDEKKELHIRLPDGLLDLYLKG